MVEGRYDKNTLSQLVDGVILETSGFGIFKDEERLALLRRLAGQRGIIVLTDSDGAGFVIRNFLKGALPAGQVYPRPVRQGTPQTRTGEGGQARGGGHASRGAGAGPAPGGRHRFGGREGGGAEAASTGDHQGRSVRSGALRRAGGDPAAAGAAAVACAAGTSERQRLAAGAQRAVFLRGIRIRNRRLRIFRPRLVACNRTLWYAGSGKKGDAMSLGERIQSCRKRSGRSQEQLAEHLGVSRQAVSKWERGVSHS